MTSKAHRDELHKQIWSIANDVRGAVDGWDFKQYVTGALFYRFISENFQTYIEAGDTSVNYANFKDVDIPDEIKKDAIKTKGFYIAPSQLFCNMVKNANKNDNLNTELFEIFQAIESSAIGSASENDIKGLFGDFDTRSSRLGNTVAEKNQKLADVLKGIAKLDFGTKDFNDNQIDLFGDAYEYLINKYAANAGKSGGEYFTPQSVSSLIARLAIAGKDKINGIYDPASGSGSLLLQAKKKFSQDQIEDGFFGQDINHTTYNLARMNMFLHNVNYEKFTITLGDTLIKPNAEIEAIKHEKHGFDAIISNPPYSIKWKGNDDPTLINDDRFAPAGVLPPKSKADFAFILHCLNYLSAKGRAAIVCFPGIFYRGGAEQKIRKYLIDNNYIEAVISMPPNLFYGTSIAVTLLILAKNKVDATTQFIDASGEEFFDKETNNNILKDGHIKKILDIFTKKEDIDHISKLASLDEIRDNDYNLSVNSYVEAKDTREIIDITKLNAEIQTTVAKIDNLRGDIDKIINEIEKN
jgi:type I restriction enzyme M protein